MAGETWFDNHLKIDNTNLDPDEVADIIIQKYNFVPNDKEEHEYRFGFNLGMHEEKK